MDELAETASGYGDGRKTKVKFSKLDRVFFMLMHVLRSNPDLFPVSPPLSRSHRIPTL